MKSPMNSLQTIIRLHPALKARAQAFCQQSEATLTMNALMRQALIEKLDREDGTVKVTMTSEDFCKAVRRAVLHGDWSFFEFEKHDHDQIICHVQEFDFGYKIRLLAQILGGRSENIVAMNVVDSIDDFHSISLDEILWSFELRTVRAKMDAGFGKLTGR